ncbi:MAG: hypothetical protein PF692_09035 [Kiritimatiellae bacterium]|nr:hypothetical protein [Kiritimatiellia bacterium]
MLNRFKCTATIMAEKRMPKVYGTMHVSNSDYRWLALLVPYAGSDSM